MKPPRNEREAHQAMKAYSDEAAPWFFDDDYEDDEFESMIVSIEDGLLRLVWIGVAVLAGLVAWSVAS